MRGVRMFTFRSSRAGFTLVELIAGTALVALLGAMLSGLLVVQLRVARDVAARAQAADAVRTAAGVVAGEARRMMPEDVRAIAPDSLSVRSFRGRAIICGQSSGWPVVSYRGERLPDPRKDSVLVVAAAGATAVGLLESKPAPAPCAADELTFSWRLSAPPESAAVLLLFESGSYYLSTRALRYRLGAEGRQPLTAELFTQNRTRFHPEPGAVGMSLETARPLRRLHLNAPFAAPVPP